MAELADSVKRTSSEVDKIRALTLEADNLSATNRANTLELKTIFKNADDATRVTRPHWKRKHFDALREVKGIFKMFYKFLIILQRSMATPSNS